AEDHPPAALPFDPREGIATVGIEQPSDRAELLTGSLTRTVIRFALPAVAATMLMTVFGSVDAFWVGTRIGPEGLAAVSMSIFWIWLLISLAEMVSVGVTAVAARRHGQGKPDHAAQAVGNALIFSLALGIVAAAVGSLGLRGMFAIMHAPPAISDLGRRYLGTYLGGAPLIFGFFAVDAAFRAAGDSRTPFLLLTASVLVALVLDPVLILGFGPIPRLGIAGAAVATIITRGTAFLAGTAILVRRGLLRSAGLDAAVIGSIVRVGAPTALTGVSFSLIYVFLTRTTTRFGTPALAALGIGHRVESWAFMIGVGFGAAAAAIVGQNLGAGQVARAARAGWIATAFASIVSAIACVLEYRYATTFAGLFTSDPAVVLASANYLRIAAISILFIGAELVLEGSLGGAGDTLPPMLTSTTLTALRLPLAAWAAPRWGIDGIWWTISITAGARGLAMVGLWAGGRWKRKSV
nr:MATE family efflux transporter [Gemmatimonadota bacterium]